MHCESPFLFYLDRLRCGRATGAFFPLFSGLSKRVPLLLMTAGGSDPRFASCLPCYLSPELGGRPLVLKEAFPLLPSPSPFLYCSFRPLR